MDFQNGKQDLNLPLGVTGGDTGSGNKRFEHKTLVYLTLSVSCSLLVCGWINVCLCVAVGTEVTITSTAETSKVV